MGNAEGGRRKEKKITGQGRLPLAAGRFQLLAVQRPEQIATKAPRHKVKREIFWLIFIFASVSWWRNCFAIICTEFTNKSLILSLIDFLSVKIFLQEDKKIQKRLPPSGKQPCFEERINKSNFLSAFKQDVDVDHSCNRPVHRCITVQPDCLHKVHRINTFSAFSC